MILAVYAQAYRGTTAEQLAAAAADGFEGVELRGGVDGVPLTRLPEDRLAELAALAAEHRLRLVTLALGAVGSLAADPEGLRHVARLAARIGARVRVFSSNRPGVTEPTEAFAEPPAEVFAAEVEALRTCVKALREGDPACRIMIEAEPISVANTVARQARLMDAAGIEIGFNWDFVNCWMGGEYPWPEPWRLLKGWLLGVHFKAARAVPRQPRVYASQCLPAASSLPHKAMWDAWREAGFDGPVTVDPHYPLFAPADRFDPEPDNPQAEICRLSLRAMRRWRR